MPLQSYESCPILRKHRELHIVQLDKLVAEATSHRQKYPQMQCEMVQLNGLLRQVPSPAFGLGEPSLDTASAAFEYHQGRYGKFVEWFNPTAQANRLVRSDSARLQPATFQDGRTEAGCESRPISRPIIPTIKLCPLTSGDESRPYHRALVSLAPFGRQSYPAILWPEPFHQKLSNRFGTDEPDSPRKYGRLSRRRHSRKDERKDQYVCLLDLPTRTIMSLDAKSARKEERREKNNDWMIQSHLSWDQNGKAHSIGHGGTQKALSPTWGGLKGQKHDYSPLWKMSHVVTAHHCPRDMVHYPKDNLRCGTIA
ncbi:hypothetical protein C8J56DRAFT_903928 [Mycena floridula]|nr:hypothetical protein C8J56DRAFT_903928 [Mycena floridula]